MPEKSELMEAALRRQLADLQRQNDDMRQLGTTDGFIKAWFALLREEGTHEEAFTKLNERYFEFWREYRYSDYESFRKAKNYYLKNKRT